MLAELLQYIQFKLLTNHSSYVILLKKTQTHDKHISDNNYHHIPGDNYYMVCNYLE